MYLKLFMINDTPLKIALGFGLGAFVGVMPGVGPVVAFILAFLFRVNRVSALLGSILLNWRENFRSNEDKVRVMKFDETFIHKWEYYFFYCAAAFHMRNIHVAQMVFTRANHQRAPANI